MKNYILGLFSIAALIATLGSCKEDIVLTGDFQETAVVYGLLDQSESIHMIKITRAFIGPGNSLEIAKNPDSSYFENVDATITEFVNGIQTNQWDLIDTMVDNKDQNGVFYAPQQKLYYFKSDSIGETSFGQTIYLNDNATYSLNIDINNGEFTVNGETEIVTDISSPKTSATTHYNFAKNANATGEFQTTSVSVGTGNAKLINTSLTINYKEFIGAATTDQSVVWNLGETGTQLNSTVGFTMNGEAFYTNLASACANGNPLVDKRNMTSITLKIVGGSDDLYNYILVNQPSSSLAQNKPTFTNLTVSEGHQVIGLFSSRYTLESTVPFHDPSNQWVRCLDKNSTMELCVGAITGSYLFCSDHILDISQGESYACP